MEKREKIYTLLCTVFAMVLVIGNLTWQKFVFIPILPFHTFELSVAVTLYPLAFQFTDLITEFYGKERASNCVKVGMISNIFVATIMIIFDSLTATPWSNITDHEFNKMFGFYGVAFGGSLLACFISQQIDIKIYLAIKKLTKGKLLWLRNNVSTAISLLIDTMLALSIFTYFKAVPIEKFWDLAINGYSFKLMFTLCATPLFYMSVWIMSLFINKHE